MTKSKENNAPPNDSQTSAPFLLCLSNTRSGHSKRPLRFALSQCTMIAQRRISCVSANGGKSVELHVSPDGCVFYGGEHYDTVTIRTGSGKTRPLSRRKARIPQKMRRVTEYLRWDGSYCLYCKQEDLEVGIPQVGGGKAWQKIKCRCCKKFWNDVYTLTGVLED